MELKLPEIEFNNKTMQRLLGQVIVALNEPDKPRRRRKKTSPRPRRGRGAIHRARQEGAR